MRKLSTWKTGLIVTVDPGSCSGALAIYQPETKETDVLNMPPSKEEIFDAFKTFSDICALAGVPMHIVCENVGKYRPGNSGPAAVKFGRHCGHLDMAFIAIGHKPTMVAPAVWMRKDRPTLSKEKSIRKRTIKAEMAAKHPTLRVTLKNADALGILEYTLKYL